MLGKGRVISGLLCLLCAVSVLGCKNTPKEPTLPGDWVSLGAPRPVSSNATRGLEVQMLVVKNTDYAVARALAPFDELAGMVSESDRALWRDWGFRWCVVPIGEVNGFLAKLIPIQPVQVQWLGEFSQWRPIVRGGEIYGQVVRVGEGESILPDGQPRLIGRSWIQPMISNGGMKPGVRMDLALQVELTRTMGLAKVLNDNDLTMIDDDGPVVGGLLTGIHADGHFALVLVGDAPDRDWLDLPAPLEFGADGEVVEDSVGPRADGALEDESVDLEAEESPASGARSGRWVVGPDAGEYPTLGELMLTSPGSGPLRAGEVYDPPRSVVVVLIPRVQGGYGLIPAMPGGKDED